ncbi:MAG: right-handed parallel beta-helix repeat-containing protein [Actinomycetota bacterium]
MRSRSRSARLWLLALAALTAGSGILAVAAEGLGVSILPGKRLERPDPSARPTEVEPGTTAEADDASEPPGAQKGKREGNGIGRCHGTVAPVGGSLQATVGGAPEGAVLCLQPGTYTTSAPIVPKDGQTLMGSGRKKTFVTTSSADAVFDAKRSTDVVFKRLDISGAVAGQGCEPACGRGIAAGLNTVIKKVRLHHNAVGGVGGSEGNLLITRSELDHNGGESFIGCCAAGVKTGSAFTIEDSYVHDNVGVGIWCDVGCDGTLFVVRDNTVLNNTMGGIRYEISSVPAVIQGNTVQGNNILSEGGHGGIEINSSANVVVQQNVLGSNGGVGVIAGGNRAPGLSNVEIIDNVLQGEDIQGCGAGVSCVGNY